MSLHGYVEQIWWRRKSPPVLLRWASGVYAIINNRNLAKRAQNTVLPSIPLISVGNITVGGSGKTPFVIWLCKQLQQRGYKPVILCRGDGGKLRQPQRSTPPWYITTLATSTLCYRRYSHIRSHR